MNRNDHFPPHAVGERETQRSQVINLPEGGERSERLFCLWAGRGGWEMPVQGWA